MCNSLRNAETTLIGLRNAETTLIG
eukprot:COSAG01_NODE_22037_length_874_cov_2.401290_1_plen_24_part_01